MKFFAIFCSVLLALPALAAPPIRVACVGDSITEGAGADPGFSYPSQLQTLLGEGWKVENFGIGGRTALKQGDAPYWKEVAYQNALKLEPNVVIIMLGTNDSRAKYWQFESDFIADYTALVQSFQALASKPKIYICRPLSVVEPGNFGVSNEIMTEIRQRIDHIAAEMKLAVIDMNAALLGKPEWFPDRIHPNTQGALEMAKTAAAALTSQLPATANAKPPIRLACVGDSITQGYGADPGFSYPSQLQTLLGDGWKVGNFGVSGRTLLKKGDFPYWKEDAYQNALRFLPNVVIIMLGTNDTKPQNWQFESEYTADYNALVQSFRALTSEPKIYVCRPCPVLGPGQSGFSNLHVLEEIKRINQLAAEMKLGIIDMNAALDGKPGVLSDVVHPSNAGALEMAKAAAKALVP
jgi:acyl-CoA thioesterase I